MTLADKIHKAADGKWWYAPLTLCGYWIVGSVCFWATASMIAEGRFGYLWRGLRLFADGDRTIAFEERSVAFVLLALLFVISGVGFFVAGWVKFNSRKRNYLANGKYL